MITYNYDSDNNRIDREQYLSFDCSIGLGYDEYIKTPSLHKQVAELDDKYGIRGNIYEALKQSLVDLETRDGANPKAQGKLSDKLTKRFIGQKQESSIELVGTSFEALYGPGNYEDIEFIEVIDSVFADLVDLSKTDKKKYVHTVKSSQQRYIREYLVFLFLVKKEKLFRCIEPISMNIDVVDTGNLHHHIKNKARIILPVDEYLYRGNIHNVQGDMKDIYHKLKQTHAILDELHDGESDPEYKASVTQATTPFAKDITDLQRDYPYIGTEQMFDKCKEWLADSRTSRLLVELKKTHWLVKPTIKQDAVDRDIEIMTTNYGTINIKHHTPSKHTIKHTEYSPTYIILKSEEE